MCLQWTFMLVHNECYFTVVDTMCANARKWVLYHILLCCIASSWVRSVIVVVWWTILLKFLFLSRSLNGTISFIQFNVIFHTRKTSPVLTNSHTHNTKQTNKQENIILLSFHKTYGTFIPHGYQPLKNVFHFQELSNSSSSKEKKQSTK